MTSSKISPNIAKKGWSRGGAYALVLYLFSTLFIVHYGLASDDVGISGVVMIFASLFPVGIIVLILAGFFDIGGVLLLGGFIVNIFAIYKLGEWIYSKLKKEHTARISSLRFIGILFISLVILFLLYMITIVYYYGW